MVSHNQKEEFKEIPGYGIVGSNYVETSLGFEKGWNLVQGLPNPEWLSGGSVKSSNIKAIYGFDPIKQEYIRFYPNPEKNKLRGMSVSMDCLVKNTAFWVYSDTSGTSEYWIIEPVPLDKGSLLKGWNFVGITADMSGKTIEEMSGDCKIESSYYWNANIRRSSGWNAIGATNNRVDKENVGHGILIRVLKDCNLR